MSVGSLSVSADNHLEVAGSILTLWGVTIQEFLTLVMVIRTGDPREFNKGRSSKFRLGSRVQEKPEEGRKTYQPKRCGNNNKDEDNSLKTLNDKNQPKY